MANAMVDIEWRRDDVDTDRICIPIFDQPPGLPRDASTLEIAKKPNTGYSTVSKADARS